MRAAMVPPESGGSSPETNAKRPSRRGFFFSSRRRHTRFDCDWSSDVCSSDLNSLGRKRILLRLNEEHGFFLGVGFDDEAVLAAVMDLRPRIHSIAREATQLEGGMNGLAHQLLSCAHEAMRQAGLKAESLLGMGIAGSGLVNSQEGTMVMSSTIESIKHVPLRRIFEKEFEIGRASCRERV